MVQSELYRSKGDGRQEQHTEEEEDQRNATAGNQKRSERLLVFRCSGDTNTVTLILLLLFPVLLLLWCVQCSQACACSPQLITTCSPIPYIMMHLAMWVFRVKNKRSSDFEQEDKAEHHKCFIYQLKSLTEMTYCPFLWMGCHSAARNFCFRCFLQIM